MKQKFFFSTLFLLLAATMSLGQSNQTISYQGFLADANGKALPNGSYTLTVRLYDSATSNTPLWTEPHTVAIKNGIFSVVLGSSKPLDIPLDKPYWIAHLVGTGLESTPRTKLAASTSGLNGEPGGFTLISSTMLDNGSAGTKKANPSQKLAENGGYTINGCLIINCSR